MNELATYDINKSIDEINNVQKLCQILIKTPHYSKMGQEGIYAVVAKARALNIDVFEALNGALYYVSGKVGMGAELMAQLVRRAGHSIVKDKSSNDSVCILHGKRTDNGDEWTVSFSIKDADRAQLSNGNSWKKYPGIMCYNRAMSMLFRQLFPDLSRGAGYTEDELQEASSTKRFAQPKEEIKVEGTDTIMEEYVTEEQFTELQELLHFTNPQYRQSLYDKLLTLKEPVTQLSSLKAKHFDRVRSDIIKNTDRSSGALGPDNEEIIMENEEDINDNI